MFCLPIQVTLVNSTDDDIPVGMNRLLGTKSSEPKPGKDVLTEHFRSFNHCTASSMSARCSVTLQRQVVFVIDLCWSRYRTDLYHET